MATASATLLIHSVFFLSVSCNRPAGSNGPGAEAAERLLRVSNAKDALDAAERGLAGPHANAATQEHWRLRNVQIAALASLERFRERERILALSVPPAVRATEPGVRFLLARRKPEEQAEIRRTIQTLKLAELIRRDSASDALNTLSRKPSPEAEREVRRIRAEAKAAGDSRTFAFATGNLGFHLAGQFRLDEALSLFHELLEASTADSDLLTVASTQANLGWVNQLMGHEERAGEFYVQAERNFQKLGVSAQQRTALRNLGSIAYFQGNFQEARRYFERAQALIQPESAGDQVVGLMSDLAASDIELNRVAEAEADLAKATAVPGHEKMYEYPWMLLTRGRIAEKRGADPLVHYRAAAALDAGRDQVAVIEARLRIANWLGSQAALKDTAAKAYEEALGAVAKLRKALRQDESKMAFAATVTRVYQDYVDFLVSSKQPVEALRVADSSRLQVFSESAPRAAAKLDLAQLSSRLAKAKTSVYYYWLAPKRSFLWIVDGKGVRLAPEMVSSNVFAEWVHAYSDFIERGGAAGPFSYQPAFQLRGELIDKAGGTLPKRIIVVPDGALHWMNFETLSAPGGELLIQQAEVSVVPSLGILSQNKPAAAALPSKTPSALLIGNPVTEDPAYPLLQNAHGEIAAIGSLYPRKQSFEGEFASPEAYLDSKPGEFDLIHFAAHAEANSRSPLDSSVVLTPGMRGNRLSAREVVKLPVKANLVTLSACYAAGSKAYSGEGLVGFSWAFLRAGARNVVAGLWRVDDESTSTLMRDFYELMKSRKLSPAAGLREAKLRMMLSGGAYAKPYYWAPFQVFSAVIE